MHALQTWNRLPLWIGIAIAAAVAAGADRKVQALNAPASGDSPGLRAPVAGLLAPAGGPRLRTIVGAPGAAVFGDSIPVADDTAHVWISPAGTFALAAPQPGYPLSSVHLRGGVAFSSVLEGIVEPVEMMGFSPDGSAAALYAHSSRRLYVLSQLPDQPAAREVDLRSLPGRLVSAALSDRAALVALGSFDGHAGTVDVLLEDGSYQSVWTGAAPASLKFAANMLLLSDPAENRVLRFTQAEDSWTAAQLAGAADGLDEPGAIEVLPDRKSAVVANRKSGSVLWIETGSGKSRIIELPSVPQSISPMGARNALIISTSKPEGHWVLSPGPEEPVLTLISDSLPGATRQ